MASTFYKFPNNSVWRVSPEGRIAGVVACSVKESEESLESFLDAMAEAVVGDSVGFIDFGYRSLGDDMFSFSGRINPDRFTFPVEDSQADNDDEGTEKELLVKPSREELETLLKDQFGLLPSEVSHAISAMDAEYDNECVVCVAGTNRAIHTPAYPEPCSYVRIVVAEDIEVAYWNIDELRGDAAEAMGAIIGACHPAN